MLRADWTDAVVTVAEMVGTATTVVLRERQGWHTRANAAHPITLRELILRPQTTVLSDASSI